MALTAGLIVIITLLNLRGVRERDAVRHSDVRLHLRDLRHDHHGGGRLAAGDQMLAESADWQINPEATFTGLALVFLLARAFHPAAPR